MTAVLYINAPTFNEVTFTPVTNPSYERGKLVYDADPEAESLTFFSVETETEVHLGRETQIPVRNSTGATIAAGAAVRINGNHPGTQLPTVTLAQADSEANAQCIGIAAHSIENNTIGYVYVVGLAHHNINTQPYSNGDVLYLSPTVAGALQVAKPTAPNWVVRVGIVTRASANGAIYTLVSSPKPGV